MNSVPALPSGLAFAKGHGTGNDFILVADPAGDRNITPGQVELLCNRRLGIGGDGLIVAVRSSTLPEGQAILQTYPDAEWFMDYRNADGSVSEMCGNGVRVFVHFLITEGLLEIEGATTVKIGTRAGPKTVSWSADGYAVDMGSWCFPFPELAASRASDSLVDTVGLSVDRPALSVSMGNPHTVVALADAAELQAIVLTAQPQVLPVPPDGTNVEYVVPAEPLVEHGVGRVAMRVHERGVGETLSCGTGACAAAVATRYWAGSDAPDAWQVEVPGGLLGVRFIPAPDGREHVELSGPAVIVARGVLA